MANQAVGAEMGRRIGKWNLLCARCLVHNSKIVGDLRGSVKLAWSCALTIIPGSGEYFIVLHIDLRPQPESRRAILPETAHVTLMNRKTTIVPMVSDFLDAKHQKQLTEKESCLILFSML